MTSLVPVVSSIEECAINPVLLLFTCTINNAKNSALIG